MGIDALGDLAGEWELAVDLPGAADVRGHVVFEPMGEVLVQRTTVPVPEAPDSCCLVLTGDDGGYIQHYFDSRGVARLYAARPSTGNGSTPKTASSGPGTSA
jgi:hypothetical protein